MFLSEQAGEQGGRKLGRKCSRGLDYKSDADYSCVGALSRGGGCDLTYIFKYPTCCCVGNRLKGRDRGNSEASGGLWQTPRWHMILI